MQSIFTTRRWPPTHIQWWPARQNFVAVALATFFMGLNATLGLPASLLAQGPQTVGSGVAQPAAGSSAGVQEMQSSPLSPEGGFQSSIDAGPELQKAAEALRAHLKEMREVMVRFSVSESREEDQKWRNKWIDLQQAGAPIHEQFVRAATEQYKADPEGNPGLAKLLFTIVKRNAEADRYENMLPVALALDANGFQAPVDENMDALISMIAFAMNEHDILEERIERLVAAGLASAKLIDLQENMDSVRAAWKAEQAARKSDAEGDPLPRVLMRTTKGDMEIELFENQAPETVANFLHLVEMGFYDGLTFHRVLQHFVAQGGCPVGDGTGGPGYTIYSEADRPDARNLFRGTLGMALANDPDTAGSQFFICFVPTYELNDNFTAFGRVIDGMEVLPNLTKIDPEEKKEDEKGQEPKMPDEIIEIEVLYKRDHEYKPNKVE